MVVNLHQIISLMFRDLVIFDVIILLTTIRANVLCFKIAKKGLRGAVLGQCSHPEYSLSYIKKDIII